ncbi:MAG TPA: nucleoside transporter C-terminal domain-containing protein [Thermodesulfovibrionia bacterium]|nr:nucleoside transporter C-terminal domain-containing protein [Thermodesulfovibrionia bacterium]
MTYHGIFGLFVLIGLAWIVSEGRGQVAIRELCVGVAIQFILGVVLLKLPVFQEFFLFLNKGAMIVDEATMAGTSFVFGYLGGGALPFQESSPGHAFVFAFRALPLVLVISALSSLLFYWQILPLVIRAFTWGLKKTMNMGGAAGFSAAANIFVGMVEAPLFIRPYLKDLTRSELFIVMTCGMATVAGTVMVLYANILSSAIPDAMGHILTASILSVPAAITISRIMIPETQEQTQALTSLPETANSSMEAISKGTIEGIHLLINIVAMLVVLVALVHLINQILSLLPAVAGQPITLQRILGLCMAPVVWLMGIPWSEAQTAGTLMGTKTILNELIAYIDLANLPDSSLSQQSRIILTYAMCGFANPGSLGILIGGMSTMAPERRDEIVALGLKSIVAGTLATCMTGTVVGILYNLFMLLSA